MAGLLERPELMRLFFAQPSPDQRHAVDVARRYLTRRPGDRSGAAAALLHDVGKRHARLGAVGRSLATVWGVLGLPRSGRVRIYLDHGPIGADELEQLAVDRLVVDFARHHGMALPPGVELERWRALTWADHV